MKSLGSVVCLLAVLATSSAKVAPKVKCTPTQMRVEVPISGTTKGVYIEGLRDYPDPACRPHTDPTGNLAILELDLEDVFKCGVTRVINQQTGKRIYYQKIVIENLEKTEGSPTKHEVREILHVKCSVFPVGNHTITKRNVLPAGFREPEGIEIMVTDSTTGRAPEPILGVGVRQNGKLVSGELNVSPGTPLQMEIFLDNTSAPIYGLLVTHMQVTDTKAQEETIIYNGCSVDPFLFENFNTVDGDFLAAKFRAFKFPESTYVQFKGTVNVCLDKCKGVECSDGQIGYGRRKRAIPTLPADPNRIFEITITSFIKVGADGSEEIFKEEEKIYNNNNKLIVGNQMTDIKDKTFYMADRPKEVLELTEEKQYTSILAENSSATCVVGVTILLSVISLFL